MSQDHSIDVSSGQSGRLVEALANRTHHPLDEVRRVYETQFHQLEVGARLRTYVPVLAARRAREILLAAEPH